MSTIVFPRRATLPESRLLALICTIDLILTLWLVESGMGVEANPIMRFYYDIAPAAFVMAKTFLFAVPLLLLEHLHERNPRFIRALLRTTVVLYVVVYLIGIAAVNA